MKEHQKPKSPIPEIREDLDVNVERPRCPFCHDEVLPTGQEKLACTSCMAWHHQACWQEHGGCSACAQRQETSPSAQRPRSMAKWLLLTVSTLVGLLVLGGGTWMWNVRASVAQAEREARWEQERQELKDRKSALWEAIAKIASPRPQPAQEEWRQVFLDAMTNVDEAVLYRVQDSNQAAPKGSKWDYGPRVPRRVVDPAALKALIDLSEGPTLSQPLRLPRIDHDLEEWDWVYALVLKRGGVKQTSLHFVRRAGVWLVSPNRFRVKRGVVLDSDHGVDPAWLLAIEELWSKGENPIKKPVPCSECGKPRGGVSPCPECGLP